MTDDLDRLLAGSPAVAPSPQFTARVMGAVRREAARADARASLWASRWPALTGTVAVAPLIVLVNAVDLPMAGGATDGAVWLGMALLALFIALPVASPLSRRS
jgi:hypothetical protein